MKANSSGHSGLARLAMTIRVRLMVSTLVVVGTGWASGAQVKPPDRSTTISAVSAAVVTIRGYDGNGKPIGLGSGFILPDGRIATNRHVIAGAALVEARTANSLLGSFSFAEVVSISADLAILPKAGDAPSTVRLAEGEILVGTHVFVIGAPLGLQRTVSDGIVSGIRDLDGQSLLQMTAPISQGSSGGPVINDAGLVVGVTVGLVPDGQNLNFAVPVRELRALMASPVGKIPFPAATATTSATAKRPTPSASELPSFLDAIPKAPLSLADDTDFRVEFRGCFGSPVAPDVVVCACKLRPRVIENRRRSIGVWRATIRTLDGGSAVADAATDLTTIYPFSGGQRGVIVNSASGSELPLYIRFLVKYELDARPVMEIGLGGNRPDRTHAFPPTAITLVDVTKNVAVKEFFGVR